MKQKSGKILIATVSLIFLLSFPGCWYSQDDPDHPTDPDATGAQGWSLFLTITPSTAPANGDATMDAQAKFWDLSTRAGVPDQDVYLSIYDSQTGRPADVSEIHFLNGTNTAQARTDGLGLANVTIKVGYLKSKVAEKNYYVRAEATVDFDNNALQIWDVHTIRLYNPYHDEKSDDNPPTAVMIVFPNPAIVGEEVSFDGSHSYDTDYNGNKDYDQIVSWEWSFGDGTKAYGEKVTHRFNYYGDGNYTIQLKVVDDDGMIDTTTTELDMTTFSTPTPVPQ